MCSNDVTIAATAAAQASGVDGCGVSMRTRSAAVTPSERSTGAPVMPEPPMSMPSTSAVRAAF